MKSLRYIHYRKKTRQKKSRNAGEQFELKVFENLSKQAKSYVYHSTYIPIHRNNGITEIDIIVVNQYRILCFEVKYSKEPLIGLEHDKLWFKQGTQKSIRNPFIQNSHHVRALSDYLKVSDKHIINCVVVNNTQQSLPNLYTLDTVSLATSNSRTKIFTRKELRKINRALLRCHRFKMIKAYRHKRYRTQMKKKHKAVS
ncbi:nuclease-related domain-containing protein [Erysipelothrix tonsillarum]